MDQNIIQYYKEKIEEIYPLMVSARRHIHSQPELSEAEEETSSYISSHLNSLGIRHHKSAGHGICATIYGTHTDKTSKTIAIRADMDALPLEEETGLPFASKKPGVMHACGHDIHTAVLLGAAYIFSQNKDKLKGNVRLIFQPAEETIGGAERMIKEGCLKNPDVSAAIGFHVSADHPAGSVLLIDGPMSAASTEFKLAVTGISSHGAHPHTGSDALLAGAYIITALQSIISRSVDPVNSGVVTVGTFNSGTKSNIMAGTAVCTGIIRALSLESRELIKSKVKLIAETTAESFGCNCNVTFNDSYPSTENDSRLFQLVKDLSEQAIGKEHTIISKISSMGAEDFAYFCHEVPSFYMNIGAAHDDESLNHPLHSNKFNPVEESMKNALLMEILTVLNIMETEL